MYGWSLFSLDSHQHVLAENINVSCLYAKTSLKTLLLFFFFLCSVPSAIPLAVHSFHSAFNSSSSLSIDVMACAPPEVPNAKPRHRKQRVLFDSLTLHFSFAVFVEQFLNHMLFPLLLPWMVYKNGWNCLIAQGFIPIRFKRSDIMLALWHWFSPVMFYHVVFVHFLNICHVKISIMYPVIFYTMHRSMVALKYATLSPSELRRLLRVS